MRVLGLEVTGVADTQPGSNMRPESSIGSPVRWTAGLDHASDLSAL
jgi:hypothetical protein